MDSDLKGFWNRFQAGIEVAVASSTPDELLGVRDGILRYVHRGLGRSAPVAVVSHPLDEPPAGLPLSDEQTVGRARRDAAELRDRLGDVYQFYVATHGGLHAVEVDGTPHYFVRSWTVVASPAGDALGASGSLEIPPRLVEGMEASEIPLAVPGTRRRGGLIASLTGGVESRRSAVAESTFHALSSLFYGILGRGGEAPPGRSRGV